MSRRKSAGAGKLKLDPQNARKHPDRNKAQIAASLKELGAGRSILVDATDTVIAGNGVFEQAQALGYKVKVVETDGKTLIAVKRPDLKGARSRRMALADNRANETSEWDVDALAEIAKHDAEMLDGLFEERELRELLKDTDAFGGKGEPAEDETLVDRAEELQKKWDCKPGDVWQADKHYFICGDCRDFGTWQKLLAAAGVDKVNGVFTSPPYAEQRKKQYGGVPTDKYVEWWNEVQANVRANLAPDGSFFVNIKPHKENGERAVYVYQLVLSMVSGWGWRFIDELCWKKNGLPGDFSEAFRNDFEPVYHFAGREKIKFRFANVYVRGAETVNFIPGELSERQGTGHYTTRTRTLDGIRPSNVIEIPADSSGNVHAAAFPVALPEFFVKAYSDAGDAWLDPFLGSGTTIVAAHRNERRGLGIETLPKYCAVICERLTAMGLTAKRVSDGKAKARG